MFRFISGLADMACTHIRKKQRIEVKNDESMPVFINPNLQNIVTDYLGGDIDVGWPGDSETKPFTPEQRSQFRLFDKPIEKLIMNPDVDAAAIGNLILRAEEQDVNQALELIAKKIENNPAYLHYHVIAVDPCGRQVKGTLLQIAAMAGDVDLKADIREEKLRGLVERIAKVGKLSNKEVALQLQVITSKEAQEANEKRNQRILNAFKKFEEGLIQKAKEYKGDRDNYEYENLEKFRTFCKPDIDELEKALTPNLEEIITSGFVFDTAIFAQAAKCYFNSNLFNSDRLASAIFLANGIGKLQSQLSSRDAQMTISGISHLIDIGKVPPRTLRNSEGHSYFFNPASGLGKFCFITYPGSVSDMGWLGRSADMLGDICQTKTAAIANLCDRKKTNIRQVRR